MTLPVAMTGADPVVTRSAEAGLQRIAGGGFRPADTAEEGDVEGHAASTLVPPLASIADETAATATFI